MHKRQTDQDRCVLSFVHLSVVNQDIEGTAGSVIHTDSEELQMSQRKR